MRPDLLALLFAAAPALLCACPKGGPPPVKAHGDECHARVEAARARVDAVLQANATTTCTADDDCTLVAVENGCFDACTSPVSLMGAQAVERALAETDELDCRTYASDGCVVEHPPCAPPVAVSCRDGQCK